MYNLQMAVLTIHFCASKRCLYHHLFNFIFFKKEGDKTDIVMQWLKKNLTKCSTDLEFLSLTALSHPVISKIQGF